MMTGAMLMNDFEILDLRIYVESLPCNSLANVDHGATFVLPFFQSLAKNSQTGIHEQR